ncbi:hypothetical protein [Nostoc linckia]|nr:hypothetical protein [Nostoc linckia]
MPNAQCPMPNALCPMPHAHFSVIFANIGTNMSKVNSSNLRLRY